MLITPQSLRTLSNGFNAAFKRGFEQPTSEKDMLAMRINSTGSQENYGWMKEFPTMREWVGQRVVNNLEATAYSLKNKMWENTVGIKRTHIEDDQLGIYGNIFPLMGEDAALHPDDLVFEKLLDGFSVNGGLAYDGQYFFDSDHIGYDSNGNETSFSNVQAGSGNPWFLADLSRAYMKPLVFQMRSEVELVAKDKAEDDNVFFEDQYMYGVRARYNAGFAWYQLIIGSKADLTAANYEAARQALMGQRRAQSGRKLGVRPTHLICGSSNEGAALEILNAERNASGATNIWKGTATLMLSNWLD